MSKTNTCLWTVATGYAQSAYDYSLGFSRLTDATIFAVNAFLFGYLCYKIIQSRQMFSENSPMKGKERRLYLIITCFMLKTICALITLSTNSTVITVGNLGGNLQGFFNALAMNEKEIQQGIARIFTRLKDPVPSRSSATESTESSYSSSSTQLHDESIQFTANAIDTNTISTDTTTTNTNASNTNATDTTHVVNMTPSTAIIYD